MFCAKCGFEISLQDAKYCPKCGFDLSKLTSPPSTSVSIENQAKLPSISWWKIPLRISLFFFGAAIFLGIAAALLISLIPNSETMAIVSVVLILVLSLALLIYNIKQWGWGWYLVSGILYTSIQKTYTGYGVYQGAIHLFGIITALFVYYAFRDKYLTKVKKSWLRSVLAGIVALFLGAFFTGMLSAIVPNQDHRVAKIIQNENIALQASVKAFTEQNNQLWSRFVSEPATTKDFQTNLAIVQELTPLYRRKDSILVNAMQRMYSGIKNIYDESSAKDWSLSFTPTDFQQIVEKTQDISRYDELMFSHLSSYYKSVLSGEGSHEQHWQGYQDSQQQLNAAAREYARLFEQLFGYDISGQLNKTNK